MFVDTNVLVYAAVPAAPLHDRARDALAAGAAEGPLCLSRQVLREFLAVLTRPQVWARPITLAAATEAVRALEAQFDVLEDGPASWQALLTLASRHAFGGRQVHDANIVATMLAHRESRGSSPPTKRISPASRPRSRW